MILLNPGPVSLTERVRQALLRPDLCHREPEFAELMLDIKARLRRVYATDHEAVVLTGSGTAAVEAMLSTLAPPDRPTLVVSNGVYGERMAAMLEAHGKPFLLERGDWLCPLDLDAVRRRLDLDPTIARVATVHHETTTGRLNDVRGLAEICGERGVGLLLDAVSSFGGEEIDFAGWAPDAVAATANKCLHGVPGVAFVLARAACLEEGHARSLYLDLSRIHRDQRAGYSPFTQAVHACHALQEALAEHEEQGGWTARRARYLHLSSAIRARIAEHGVEPLIPFADASSLLSAWRWRDYERLHRRLREAGFVIYAGQGALAGSIFRIATMGDIADADLERLLDALDGALRHA